MDELAPKYPRVKFVKIIASKCVENFPDDKVPCFLLYLNIKFIFSLYNVDKFADPLNCRAIERLLHEHAVIKCEDEFEEDENDKKNERMFYNPIK